MRERNIVVIVLISIFTCGIGYLVFFYQAMSDINYGLKENDSAGTDILLSLITCGIWGIYCHYKYAKRVASLGSDDNATINAVLAALGFSIVSVCILQSSINNIVKNAQQD